MVRADTKNFVRRSSSRFRDNDEKLYDGEKDLWRSRNSERSPLGRGGGGGGSREKQNWEVVILAEARFEFT